MNKNTFCSSLTKVEVLQKDRETQTLFKVSADSAHERNIKGLKGC